MSRLPLAALAGGVALALAAVPGAAPAQADAGPNVVVPSGQTAAAASFAPDTATGAATASGLAAVLTVNPTGLRSFSYGGTTSTDTSSTITSYSFDFGDGSAPVTNSTGTAAYTYQRAGTYTVTLTVADAAGNTAAVTNAETTEGSDFTPYGPSRLLDTRNGTGQGGTVAPVKSDGTVKLKIAGVGTIPAGVAAVVINLTAADETANGVITAWPDGQSMPSTSNLNYGPSVGAVAALATVPVGADGDIDLYNNSRGTTDLIGDVTGYYAARSGSGFTPLSPARILDTRTTTGGHDGVLASGGTLALTVAGADGGLLPGSGVTAVALNITATVETKNGDLTAYPDGSGVPATSSLDYRAGVNTADYAVVPVGADGKIDITNQSAGSTDVIADVSGYFSASGGSSYLPVTPTRSLDTRTLPDGTVCADCAAQDDVLTSTAGSATAYAVTVTAIAPTANGVATVYPAGSPLPTASNINWLAGETLANSVYATPSPSGFYVYNGSSGTVNFTIDEYGYFSNH